jgi:hypothetical protein
MKFFRIILLLTIICLAINAFADEQPAVHMICEQNVSGVTVCHEITDYQALNANV